MSTKKKHRLGKLSVKFVLYFLALGIIISVANGVIGYRQLQNTIYKRYNDTAYEIADLVNTYLDGDDIERYLATGQSDEKYQATLQTLENIREQMNLNYLYVAKADGLELTYVFDAENPNDAFPAYKIGETGGINPDFEQDAAVVQKTGKRSANYFISQSQFGYNTSAITAVRNSSGEIVAFIGIEIAMSVLQNTMNSFVFWAIGLTSVLTIVFIFVLLAFINRSVIRPINTLTRSATDFVDGGELTDSEDLHIATHDELEVLGNSFNIMKREIREYIQNLSVVTAEKERIGAELNVATQIQASMLPSIFPPFPERDEFDIYAQMTPAKEVGGDFYDFFMVDDTHLGVVIADVSGKGVPAALFMMLAKTHIKNFMCMTDIPLSEQLTIVNHHLNENNDAGMFVTAWVGVLDINSGELQFINAGHNPPLIRRKNGEYEWVKDKSGLFMGVMDGIKYRVQQTTLAPGELLLLYTDGVTEAMDGSDSLYGESRLIELLNNNADDNCCDIIHTVKADIDRYCSGVEQTDDITMLAVEFGSAPLVSGEQSFAAKTEQLDAVLEYIDEVIVRHSGSAKAVNDINIAVEELFVNVAKYAYGEGEGEYLLKYSLCPKTRQLTITQIDRGTPFDPVQRADPSSPKSIEETKIGGLGIFMAKKAVDEMSYEYKDGCNVLTLKRSID